VVAAHRAGVDAAFLRRPHTETTALSERPEYDLPGLDAVVDVTEK